MLPAGARCTTLGDAQACTQRSGRLSRILGDCRPRLGAPSPVRTIPMEAARLIRLRHRVECVVFKGADHCFQNLEQASEDSYCSHIPAFLQSLVSRTEDATDANPECIVTTIE